MTIPKHVAIIMDGNRRWARKHRVPLLLGHRKAAYEVIEPIVDVAIELGISYLTLWAFSTENWERSDWEVKGLLNLFREVIAENIEKLNKKGARLLTIGNLEKFPAEIVDKIEKGKAKTKGNKKITVVMAINYGGRDEIVRAIERLWLSSKFPPAGEAGKVQSSKLTEEDYSKYLDTVGIPDPDLIIRTGGEKRLSGFLLWQCAYSELYFTDVLFPDFTPKKFKKAVREFGRRQRRFGK